MSTNPPPRCPRCNAPLAAGLAERALCVDCVAREALDAALAAPAEAAAPAPSVEELAPHLAAYELFEVLGRGGAGTVFRARHRALGRECALKVIAREVASRPGFFERFQREVRTLARLQHPGIVAVFDAGQAGPWAYLAMELVDGVDLRQLMRAERIAPREALAIVMGLCDALQYAHDQGVVHRDIKPENIIIDRTGRARVLDFGLARATLEEESGATLTRTGQVSGTPLYMAPEQWRTPLEVDHRADIYSLGVVLYELLTGELPVGRFPAPSERVALDVRIDEVVLRALQGEPARRYQHASEVRDDLGASAAATAPAQDTSRAGASVVRRRRHRRTLRPAASSEASRRSAHPDRVLRVALAVLVLLYMLALVSLSFDDGPAERSISATPIRTP